MKKLIFATLLLGTQAMAANWVQAGESIDDTKHYIDSDSIQVYNFPSHTGGQYISAWTRYDLATADTINGKSYWQIKDFEYFDCKNQRLSAEQFAFYDKKGNSVYSGSVYVPTSDSSTWDRVAPDTAAEADLKTACAYAGLPVGR